MGPIAHEIQLFASISYVKHDHNCSLALTTCSLSWAWRRSPPYLNEAVIFVMFFPTWSTHPNHDVSLNLARPVGNRWFKRCPTTLCLAIPLYCTDNKFTAENRKLFSFVTYFWTNNAIIPFPRHESCKRFLKLQELLRCPQILYPIQNWQRDRSGLLLGFYLHLNAQCHTEGQCL